LKPFQDLSKSADINVVSRSLSDRSVSDTLTISTQSLFGDLTVKQLRSLLTDPSLGYYNSPRRITMTDISRRMSVPRTTFETHLRKAHDKVLRGLIPYLELSTKSAQPD
jgi:predicted DNA binding protein